MLDVYRMPVYKSAHPTVAFICKIDVQSLGPGASVTDWSFIQDP